MNGFWKKRLPALALALVMAASLTAPALAAEYKVTYIDANIHKYIDANGHAQEGAHTPNKQPGQYADSDYVKKPTCYQKGSARVSCTVCGFSWEVEVAATDKHVYGNSATDWQSNKTQHWKVCKTSGCTHIGADGYHVPKGAGEITKPTCTQEGSIKYTCSVCGVTYTVKTADMTAHKPNASGVCTVCGNKTHEHTFSANWTTDPTYHWHQCTQCTAETGRAAHQDASPVDGRCDSCNYAMTTLSGVTVTYYTGGGTSIENVVKGSYPRSVPSPSLSNVAGSHIFQGWISGKANYFAYRGQTLVTPANIAANSSLSYSAVYKLRATGQDASFSAGTTGGKFIGSEVRSQVAAKFAALTGQSSFSSIRFGTPTGSGKLYADSGKSSLGTGSYNYSNLSSYLYFVPSTSGSLKLTYIATDNYDNQIGGTLTISGAPSSSSSDIRYTVAPGGTVDLKVSDFERAYRDMADDSTGTVRYVTFRPGSSYDRFSGSLYTGSRELDRDRLNDWSFYISNDRYGDYALDTVNFKADKNAKDGDELSLTFRVYYNSSVYYEGTLRVTIDDDGAQGDVTYRVAPGGSVTFNRSDFNRAYQDLANSSRTVRYVEFAPGSDYTSFSGKLSVSGQSDFDRKGLQREQFNYTGTSYGDYALDDLVFRANSSAKDGDSLEIPFYACYNADDYVKGTLRIIIDKAGSKDTVTCNVAPGGSARLDKSAFNEVYRALSGYSKRTITAVSFAAPDSYRNFDAVLCAGSSRDLELSDLTHKRTWFYYSDRDEGDYALEDVTVQADRNAKEGASLAIPFRAYYDDDYEEGTLRINITSQANTITYEAAPGGSVCFVASDFNRAYQSMSGSSRTIKYVAFEANSDYASFAGGLYAGNVRLNRSDLTYSKTQFYNGTPNYTSYSIGSLYFRPDASARDKSTLTIPFRAYYSSTDYEEGTLKLVVNSNAGGDIAYTVTPGKTVNFDRTKFDDFFRETYDSHSLSYVIFDVPGSADFPESSGTLYTGYGTSYSNSFSRSSLRNTRFYYNASDADTGDFALNDLTFAAASSFVSGNVTLTFTAYGAGSRQVEGTLVITPAAGSGANATSNLVGSVRYAVTSGTSVQISANDLARFFKTAYPSGSLQYVTFTDVPAAGALYYNYYGASRYGSATREQITASSRARNFYLSPASASEYALSELTYVPSGSNYCASIPFTAYGANGQSAAGAILISVTNKAVSEVYGPTPKNTAVSFSAPAASMYAAVSAATGTAPAGFQLLKLPASNVGAVYVGSGASVPANTTTVYGYNTGAQLLSQLRFVPATNYTGPVEIPYAAVNASGTPIATGVFAMGVLNSNKKFTDVTTSTWCYKYVTELADANIIDGYADGKFKPDSTITYGAALKLIMLAAGYPEQSPVNGGGALSGYLAKAQTEGLITRSNVNLSGPITRLQMAQLAAGALKLDINNLSSVKPFTDTADVYVQALNAAGIVEGYFSNGTSTFRPSNTLTRGQVSAIVWRMRNYRR